MSLNEAFRVDFKRFQTTRNRFDGTRRFFILFNDKGFER